MHIYRHSYTLFVYLDTRYYSHQVGPSNVNGSSDMMYTGSMKRGRTSSRSPEPTRIDTITSTNGSISNIRRSPPNKIQNVRFDPTSTGLNDNATTPRSYLTEARERLASTKRGQSPQAFQRSVDRLVSSTHQKYLQQNLSPQASSYSPSIDYVSQYYYANDGEPPVDYPMDSDEDEKRLSTINCNRGLYNNGAHTKIMKNVHKSLIDRNYLNDVELERKLQSRVRNYLRSLENQALQRELSHKLIRCFSASYLNELQCEESRRLNLRRDMRSFSYEDIQDIHMPTKFDAYRMKSEIVRVRRDRSLTTSFDGQLTSPTPTSSLAAGQYSPLLSVSSPNMTRSLNDQFDAQSIGFETDRRPMKSHSSVSS